MLRHSGWIALAGVLAAIPPASATSTGTAGPAIRAVPPAATAAAVPGQGDIAPTTGNAERPAEAPPVADPTPGQAPAAKLEPAALPAPPAPEPPPPPVLTLFVDIDLASQRMTVKEGDRLLHAWPISSGRRGYATPNGTYRPQWRAKMWRSRQYDDAPMPHSVFFHRGFAVHGTYATGMLGNPASHGCIRLAPKNAAIFYNLVGKHGMESTRIVVRGSAGGARANVASEGRSGSPARRSVRRPGYYYERRPGGAYAGGGWPWVSW